MTPSTLDAARVDPVVLDLLETFRAAGGRGLLVGGLVRDLLLGRDSKDYDVEVFGLPLEHLESLLASRGEVIAVGRTFGVLRVKGLDVDFSVPRRDNKVGKGHRDFRMELDPGMSFEDAARRRDLTINSIGWDPLSGEVLDPFGGREDLRSGTLRATDPETFSEDPLRALRVAQFAARLSMRPEPALLDLCSRQDLSSLSGERVQGELEKLLLRAPAPSTGFELLRETGLLRHFPELEAMVGVPQDPEWHPEGTVWEHTMMVVDEAARARVGSRDEDLVLMYSALCHDLGKPATTVTDDEGRIRSPSHEAEGVAPTVELMERLRLPGAIIEQVAVIVRYHLAPANFTSQGATARAYRRLARKFTEAGSSLVMLERLARCDHFGRTTPDARAREFPAGDAFLERARELEVEDQAAPDAVLGRHLLARGMEAGPAFGPVLERCREIQDETGWSDPDAILERFFQER